MDPRNERESLGAWVQGRVQRLRRGERDGVRWDEAGDVPYLLDNQEQPSAPLTPRSHRGLDPRQTAAMFCAGHIPQSH